LNKKYKSLEKENKTLSDLMEKEREEHTFAKHSLDEEKHENERLKKRVEEIRILEEDKRISDNQKWKQFEKIQEEHSNLFIKLREEKDISDRERSRADSSQKDLMISLQHSNFLDNLLSRSLDLNQRYLLDSQKRKDHILLLEKLFSNSTSSLPSFDVFPLRKKLDSI